MTHLDGNPEIFDQRPPTLDQVRAWPPAINIETAAGALGISRATAYLYIKQNEFPIRTVKIGRRTKVITASLLEFLEGK